MDFVKKQLKLFHVIQSNYRSKRKFISSINTLLPYQKSALYKRLRGDTLLSIQEIVALAKEYNLSLDDLYELKKECIVLELPYYYTTTLNHAEIFVKQWIKEFADILELQNASVQIQAKELPIFYYFKYPKLAFFKLFIYNNVSWKDPVLALAKFSFLQYDDFLIKKMKDLYQNFIKIPRIEYWTSHPYHHTIRQILSSLSDELFEDQNDAIHLMDMIIQLNQDISNMANIQIINGHREPRQFTKFELYYCEMGALDNIILLNSPDRRVLFSSLFDPDYLKCYDEKIINTSTLWFQRTADLSKCLTTGNRQKLPIYFRKLNKRLLQIKKHLKRQIEYNKNESNY